MQSFDVLVLGAGIVGCACARECAQAGMRAAIVEPHVPGGRATAAAMGHIVVMDDSQSQLTLTRYSRSLWSELRPSLAVEVEYEMRGTIWVAADDEEMDAVIKKQKAYAGVASEVLDAAQLAVAEPNLRAGLAGGLLVPEDAVIYPPAAAAFFLREALERGAVLLRGHATSIGNGVVQLSDGTRYSAPHIIVAMGTDTSLLPWLPIQKRKGHLLITERYPDFLRHQLVELGYLKSAHLLTSDSVAFNIQPRRTGQLLIGSSRQSSDDPAVDYSILARMLERARCYMPGLAQLSGIRVWTGFRAATPDHLPLIGPTADPTVSLAMGFEGLGITNAPGAARLLVDHLLQRKSAIDPTPFLPARLSAMPLGTDAITGAKTGPPMVTHVTEPIAHV